MASSVKSVCNKNHKNLSVTIIKVGDAFWRISVHFISYVVVLFYPGSAKADIG